MRTLLLVLVCAFAFAGDPPLPPEAQKVVEKHDAAVEAAKKAYDTAVAKADAESTKELNKVIVAVVKKGDLDGANAIKAKLTEWESKTDVLGNPIAQPAKKLEGKALVEFLTKHPKWSMGSDKTIRFDTKQQIASLCEGEKVTYAAPFSVVKDVVHFQDHRIEFKDDTTGVFKWTGVTPQDITLAE